MAAWGFHYKTMLVWHKVRKDGGSDGRGVGFYFRNVTERVLFGVRGKNARTLAPGRRQANLIATRKREHSRKPDELYAIIEACSRGPFLELFARGSAAGLGELGVGGRPAHGADSSGVAAMSQRTTVSAEGQTITVHIPFHVQETRRSEAGGDAGRSCVGAAAAGRQCHGRRRSRGRSDGGSCWTRAHTRRWRILPGEKSVNATYVSRVLRLTLLAPELVEAILAG